MSLAQQSIIQTIHDREHIDNNLVTIDLSCTICHPHGDTSNLFLAYWRRITRDLTNPYTYSRTAIENFEIANQTRRRVILQGRLLRNDRNIFAEYKAILKGIRFIRTPAYTASDITYYTIVTSFVSNGFSERIAKSVFRRILDGENPLLPTQPLFRVI